MNAGISSSPPLATRARGFFVALALAATPILGCSGSQRQDTTPSPTDTSVPASGTRTGDETGETGDTTGTPGTGTPGAGTPADVTPATRQVVVAIDPKSGSHMTGTAVFTTEQDGKVTLTVEVKGAAPGDHAIHIHENPDCSSADAESAGPHWNPTKEPHGKWGEKTFHLGDIGNMNVNSDGNGSLKMTTDRWTIGTGGSNDVTGHSIVIHTRADDFKSQPAGASGGRIGCGVIPRK